MTRKDRIFRDEILQVTAVLDKKLKMLILSFILIILLMIFSFQFQFCFFNISHFNISFSHALQTTPNLSDFLKTFKELQWFEKLVQRRNASQIMFLMRQVHQFKAIQKNNFKTCYSTESEIYQRCLKINQQKVFQTSILHRYFK